MDYRLKLDCGSKLRGSDLWKIEVSDMANAGVVSARAKVLQQNAGGPVQFEITGQTLEAISEWIAHAKLSSQSYLFPLRLAASPHLSSRQ